MRILITNDDGIHAPGLAALTRRLARWAAEGSADDDRQLVVVAPLVNYSGASAAVGTVYERESIPYRSVSVDGAERVAAYGLDGSPALAAIVGALGGFGDRPDLIVSGINLGVNVGRSVLHSGTVGAVLTGSQLGISGLAVSLRAGSSPEEWGTAAELAVRLLPLLVEAPTPTVLNLNVPSVPMEELRGVRRGRISTAGIIKSATDPAPHRPVPGLSGGVRRTGGGPLDGGEDEGSIVLTLGAAVPALGDTADEDDQDDGALVHSGFASLTPIVGVREAVGVTVDELMRSALRELGPLAGRR